MARGQDSILTTVNPWTVGSTVQTTKFNASGGETTQNYPATGNYVVSRAGAQGTATQNSYILTPDQSLFDYKVIQSQTFTITSQAVVQLSLFLRGTLTFFGTGTNDSSGLYAGGLTLTNSSNGVMATGGRHPR